MEGFMEGFAEGAASPPGAGADIVWSINLESPFIGRQCPRRAGQSPFNTAGTGALCGLASAAWQGFHSRRAGKSHGNLICEKKSKPSAMQGRSEKCGTARVALAFNCRFKGWKPAVSASMTP
jgi:hypothetical protein